LPHKKKKIQVTLIQVIPIQVNQHVTRELSLYSQSNERHSTLVINVKVDISLNWSCGAIWQQQYNTINPSTATCAQEMEHQ